MLGTETATNGVCPFFVVDPKASQKLLRFKLLIYQKPLMKRVVWTYALQRETKMGGALRRFTVIIKIMVCVKPADGTAAPS